MHAIYLLDKVSFWWTQAFKIWSYGQWLNLICAPKLHLHGQLDGYDKIFLMFTLKF